MMLQAFLLIARFIGLIVQGFVEHLVTIPQTRFVVPEQIAGKIAGDAIEQALPRFAGLGITITLEPHEAFLSEILRVLTMNDVLPKRTDQSVALVAQKSLEIAVWRRCERHSAGEVQRIVSTVRHPNRTPSSATASIGGGTFLRLDEYAMTH